MKFKILIENQAQTLEVVGHPLELLMEMTIFFARQEECKHLMKHALRLSEVAESEFKDGNGKIIYDRGAKKEGTKIIESFMKRYEPDLKRDIFNDKKN